MSEPFQNPASDPSKKKTSWIVEYNDSPGESWSDWSEYDDHSTKKNALDQLAILIERRREFDTVFRVIKRTVVTTEEVLVDTSNDPRP